MRAVTKTTTKKPANTHMTKFDNKYHKYNWILFCWHKRSILLKKWHEREGGEKMFRKKNKVIINVESIGKLHNLENLIERIDKIKKKYPHYEITVEVNY